MDYGFSLETSGGNLLELHQDFLSLPFQANNIQLAGTFSTGNVVNIVFILFIDSTSEQKSLLVITAKISSHLFSSFCFQV